MRKAPRAASRRFCGTSTSTRLRASKATRVLDSQGLPGAPVTDITLKDCSFDGVTQSSVIRHTERVALANVRVNGKVVRTLDQLSVS